MAERTGFTIVDLRASGTEIAGSTTFFNQEGGNQGVLAGQCRVHIVEESPIVSRSWWQRFFLCCFPCRNRSMAEGYVRYGGAVTEMSGVDGDTEAKQKLVDAIKNVAAALGEELDV